MCCLMLIITWQIDPNLLSSTHSPRPVMDQPHKEDRYDRKKERKEEKDAEKRKTLVPVTLTMQMRGVTNIQQYLSTGNGR